MSYEYGYSNTSSSPASFSFGATVYKADGKIVHLDIDNPPDSKTDIFDLAPWTNKSMDQYSRINQPGSSIVTTFYHPGYFGSLSPERFSRLNHHIGRSARDLQSGCVSVKTLMTDRIEELGTVIDGDVEQLQYLKDEVWTQMSNRLPSLRDLTPVGFIIMRKHPDSRFPSSAWGEQRFDEEGWSRERGPSGGGTSRGDGWSRQERGSRGQRRYSYIGERPSWGARHPNGVRRTQTSRESHRSGFWRLFF